MKNIKIINTGGTFNKKYNPLNGKLEVLQNNSVIEEILQKVFLSNEKPNLEGLLYKDSLDMNDDDRKALFEYIKSSKEDKIIVIHGTDTMDITAKYISQIKNKTIIFTGAMLPYSIDCIEATGNLFQAIGFLQNESKRNIYIAMHGYVKEYNLMYKNRQKGVFECH